MIFGWKKNTRRDQYKKSIFVNFSEFVFTHVKCDLIYFVSEKCFSSFLKIFLFSFLFFCSTSFSCVFLLFFFLIKKKKSTKKRDGSMQRMSRGRDQWQLIVHRLHSLNNVSARGIDQESFQSRNAIFDAWEKSGSPGNKKIVFFKFCSKKKKLSKWVERKTMFPIVLKKKRFQTRHSFSKRMDNKTRE